MDRSPGEDLFVYGTLAPASPEEARRRGASADAVRGRLFDLGPYPALVDLDDPTADWVAGHVFRVDEAALAGPLDDYEGVKRGPYRRERTTSRSGRTVWVYIFAGPLPATARGPILRWEGPRVDLEALTGPAG
ncbi:MAG: gamma-glutamylcyclotransferase [Isosphaeraceae bacterium]